MLCITKYNIKKYTINLDDDPKIRWNEVINDHKHNILNAIIFAQKNISDVTGNTLSNITNNFLSGLTKTGLISFYQELEGIAESLNVDVGKMTLLQLFYESYSSCTSIIKKISNNKIIHFRSMDWTLDDFKPISINVEFIQNNEPVFIATTWIGFIGILTGMRYNAYAVSINYRKLNESLFSNFFNGFFFYWSISSLVRFTLTTYKTYDEAKNIFRSSYLTKPVYIIISSKHSGRIITRDRLRNIREIKLDDHLIQTNMDHWKVDFSYSKDDWQNIDYSRQRKKIIDFYLNDPVFNLNINIDSFWQLFNLYPLNKNNTLYITGMAIQDNYYESKIPFDPIYPHKDFSKLYPSN